MSKRLSLRAVPLSVIASLPLLRFFLVPAEPGGVVEVSEVRALLSELGREEDLRGGDGWAQH